MAKKYPWETDETQKTGGKKYPWETEETQNSSSKKYSWEDNSVGQTAATNITNRVNTWLENHDNYVKNYRIRYAGRKNSYEDSFVKDSGSWLDTVSKQADAFEAEKESILSYMDQYKGYLDEEWMESVRTTLGARSYDQKKIRDVATKDNEWWNSFGSDKELLEKYGSAEGVYQYQQRAVGYHNKYSGMSRSELAKAVVLAGGNVLKSKGEDRNSAKEEADWLASYIAGKDYDELLHLDEAKEQKQLDSSMQYLEDIDSVGRWAINIGLTPYNMDSYAPTAAEDKENFALYKTMVDRYGDLYKAEQAVNDNIAEKQGRIASSAHVKEQYKWMGVGNPNSENYDPTFGYYSKIGASKADNLINSSGINKFLEEDEVAVYNYYLGKYGEDEAKQYLDTLTDVLRYRQGNSWVDAVNDISFDVAGLDVLTPARQVIKGSMGLAAGVEQFGRGVGQLISNEELDASSLMYANAAIAEDLDGFNALAYQGTNVVGNMLPSIALSAATAGIGGAAGLGTAAGSSLGALVGNASMSLSAMGNAYVDGLNYGMNTGEARVYGTLVGAAEGALEYLMGGIPGLSKADDFVTAKIGMIKNGLLRSGSKIGWNVIQEIGEEELQNYLEPAFRAIFTGEYDAPTAEELIETAIVTAVSTSTINAADMKINDAHANRAMVKTGKDIMKREGGVDSLLEQADYMAGVTTGYDQKSLIKQTEKVAKKMDNGSTSKATAREVGKLAYTVQNQTDAQNHDNFVQKLVGFKSDDVDGRPGMTFSKDEANEIADALVAAFNGRELTKEQTGLLDSVKSNPAVQSIVESQTRKNIEKLRAVLENANMEEPATYKALTDRIGEEGRFGVSEGGKAVIRATGEEIDISTLGVATVGDGQMTFQMGDREVSAGEIDWADDNQSFLVSAVSNIENITPADATAIIHDVVDMDKPLGLQLNGIDEAFTYGFHNYSVEDLKAGEFAKNLTDKQLMSAYELGKAARRDRHDTKVENFKKMRTAADAIAEKNAAEGKEAPGAKNLTITFNKGNGEVVSFDEAFKPGELDEKRSGAGEVAKILHQMGLGTRVEFFESFLSDTLTVKNKKTREIEKARVFINDNGVEQIAYSGVYRKKDGTIRVDLNAYNGRGLTLNALAHELTHFIQQWSDRKYKVLVDFLMQEYEKTNMTMHQRVLAEQKRLEDIRGKKVSYDEAYNEVVANAMSKMFNDGKMVEKLAKLKAQDKNLAQKLWEGFKEILAKFLHIYEKQGDLFKAADDLVEMKETFEQLQNMFAEALVDASENYQAAQTIGFEMDVETESVSPAVMYSEQTWTESDYVQQRDMAAQEIAKAIGVSVKKAKAYIDSVNSIAKMIAEDRSRLDYFSSPGRSSFVDNAEYGGSFDFSTLCKKRRLLTGTFTEIQKALPNTALTANEILDIRNRMKGAGLEVSCGLCYVEGSRANMGQFAKEFLKLYKQYYPDAWQPNMADVNTPDGIEWVRINHPECYEQYEYFWNHYGTLKPGDKNLFASQQKPKLYQFHTEYKGEILNKFKNDDKVEDKNLNGGIRLQSFSDFEIVHLIDTMQIIMDMSRVGLAGQAYTKVPDFAWALGDTGLKINLSLIAKGVDEKGKLIFDDVEGMPIAEAMKLRDRYSKNVGTILVAFNDEQLMAAMADDRVDFVIPFHRSQWKKSQYEAMGLPAKTKDYTYMQNEKFIKPQFHEYRGRMVKDKATNYMPNEYWDFSKSGKENAQSYLEMCARNNKRPKFYKLLQNNGDGSYSLKADGSTDGYWKLLIDFKMYDNEGNGSPQMAVKPDFNMEEATRMLNDYSGGHSNFPVAQGIVDGFVKDYKASHKGEQYSSQDTDLDMETDSVYDGGKKGKNQEVKLYGQDGKAEDLASFIRRMHEGSRRVKRIGETVFAYEPARAIDTSGTVSDAARELRRLGIKYFYHNGLEFNHKGITYVDNGALCTIEQQVVGIYAKAFGDGMEFAGHEAFHVWKHSTERDAYVETLRRNINITFSVYGIEQANTVLREYFGGDVEALSSNESKARFLEELYALISGKIHSGANEAGLKTMFKDYTAVKAAWDDLLKKQATQKGQQYSSHETDADNAPPYAYHTLISKPDMAVTTVDSNVPKSRADVVYQAKQNAAKVGSFDPKTGSVSVYVDDIKADVLLGTDGLKHGLRRTKDPQNDANYIVTIKAGEIIKNSVRVNEMNPTKVDAKKSLVLVGIARNPSGDTYVVRSIVNRFSNELTSIDVLYAINAKKQELAATKSPRFTAKPLSETSSTISIADLLDLVNQYFPDILPEDVLKHYGYDARPEGDLGESVLYSEHDTDYTNRDLLANAFESLSRSSIEYSMIQDYKDHIKMLNLLEDQLSDLNEEIRRIRFTPGKRDTKRLQALEEKAERIAKDINGFDKKLLSMEASEPLRKVIEQERKKEAQKTKAHVKEIQQNKRLRAEQTELRHKIRKTVRDLDKLLNRGNKKQNVKEDMKGFVSKALELADYLFTDHISNDDLIRNGITVRMTPREAALVKETEEILSKLYDHADSLTDEEFTRLDAKRKANEDKLRDLLTAQRNERLNTPVYDLFNDLVTEYASLKNSKQDAVKAAYNVDLERLLRQFMGDTTDGTDSDRKKLLQNMRVADMTTAELNKLYDAYKAVLTNVRDANKVFVKGKIESIDKAAERLTKDFSKRKIPDKKLAIAVQKLANKIGWDYEKLYYALDRIGSETFTELIMNIADSENIVMRDVIEAALFRDEMVEKYGFNDWEVNKEIDREFLDATGKKFKLTLGQLMSLYAYSRREGAWDHIEYGGFVFGEAALTNPRPADSYKLSKAQCEAITDLLTKEQKGYVEDMQKFLSEIMGAKGNEVSMMLYGIKMFGEKNYFPIHIAGQFNAQAQESQAKAAEGFSSMSNAGFTHAQNPNAKAPFVLEGFNEIWVDHVNEMSRYHGTVPALEDLRRVMNRRSYFEANADSVAIKQLMENSFGKEAVEYFDNFYREANSGAITDKLQKKSKKLLSLFRKNSVAYKLSVLVQQPTSIIRAYAMIDKKYFGFKGYGTITSGVIKAVSDRWTQAHTNAYNEMLKYAPGVTMAKEIGGFDTHTGGSIRSYLLDTNKSLKQKWKTGTTLERGMAVLDLVDNNAVANLPNLADKIAWIEIWNACKRETVATHKDLEVNSEEFMQAVGERFTEVIRATQVYDSIFAKSPMLKSKNLAVQYLVNFMNEPNTVANMAESAVRDAIRGDWKSGAKKAVVLVYAALAGGLVKSFIYAMQDDDEDETYAEKYIEALVGSLVNDFNPLSYIPMARDVSSALQGYDIERPDVAIIVDAIKTLQAKHNYANKDIENMTEAQIVELEKKKDEATWNVVESVAAFIGIPVKNVRKDVMGIFNTFIKEKVAMDTTKLSLTHAFEAALNASKYFFLRDESKSKQDKLYEAILAGDKAYVSRLKGTFKTEDAYNSAVRKALRENDPRIHEAAQAYYNGNLAEYKRIFKEIRNDDKHNIIGFDNTMEAVMSEVSAIKGELEPKTENSAYNATDFVNAVLVGSTDLAQTMKEDIISYKVANGETWEEAEKSFASSVATSTRNAFDSDLLDEAGTEKMLLEYAGMDEEESAAKVDYWGFIKEHPQYRGELNQSNVEDYHEFAEPAEIPLDVFVQYVTGTKGLETIKDEWGDEVKSKREQVLEVIDSLPLTWQQKDALYLAAGYAESKILDVPW